MIGWFFFFFFYIQYREKGLQGVKELGGVRSPPTYPNGRDNAINNKLVHK
jgi:hypothetical protein